MMVDELRLPFVPPLPICSVAPELIVVGPVYRFAPVRISVPPVTLRLPGLPTPPSCRTAPTVPPLAMLSVSEVRLTTPIPFRVPIVVAGLLNVTDPLSVRFHVAGTFPPEATVRDAPP